MAVYIKPSVQKMDVVFDSALTFDKFFFKLRLLAKVKGFLTCARE